MTEQLRARVEALKTNVQTTVKPDERLKTYFDESLGILDRLIAAMEASASAPAAAFAWQHDVYAMEADGLLDFLDEEIEVHALRKRLVYETVVVTEAGLVGDGRTNNRAALERLLCSRGRLDCGVAADGSSAGQSETQGGPTCATVAADGSSAEFPRSKAIHKGLRLLFPPGDYYFAGPEGAAGGSIVLEDVENLVLEGEDGARIVTSGAAMAGDSIRLERCRNITLRNLTLDMDPLPFVFGGITAKDDTAPWIEIVLCPNSPEPDASYWRNADEAVGQVTLRKAGTCHYVREAGNGLAAARVETLGDRRYRLHLREAVMAHIRIGDTAVWHPRGRAGAGQGLSIRHSRHILVEGLRMRTAETTCVWPEYSGGLQFIDCDFVPPPDRPALVNADGFHVPGNLKGPYLENVTMHGPADDCMNFYSPAFSVADWNPAERALTLLVDFPGDPSAFFAAGNPLALMNSNTGAIDAVARIADVRPTPWKQDAPGGALRYGKRALRLTLDREVHGVLTREALGRPAWSPYHEYYRRGSEAFETARAIRAPYEHLAVNLAYVNSGFIIRHSRFGFNRALGFKCKAGCGAIHGCHFIDQAVVFECSLTWREGFLPHDIEVTDTRIERFCLRQLGLLGRCEKENEATAAAMPRIRVAADGPRPVHGPERDAGRAAITLP